MQVRVLHFVLHDDLVGSFLSEPVVQRVLANGFAARLTLPS